MPVKFSNVIFFDKNLTLAESSNGVFLLYGGTLAWRNNNPGNIKWGEFAKKYGAIGKGAGGHAIFPTYEIGRNAQKKLLFSSEKGYNKLSIKKAMAKYAPTDDTAANNDPDRYANFVAKKIGTSINTILSDLTEDQQNKMIDAMGKFEGYIEG